MKYIELQNSLNPTGGSRSKIGVKKSRLIVPWPKGLHLRVGDDEQRADEAVERVFSSSNSDREQADPIS